MYSLQVWEKWSNNLSKFWDSNLVGPWDNWCIGDFGTMLCTPSQQTQESWHKTILKDKITDCFRGSTEHCFTIALPQLIQLDGILMPDTLCFHVPAVPTGMYEKAKQYIKKQPSHIRICKTDRMNSAGKPEFFFYVLSVRSKFTSLSDKLIGQYESIASGYMPKGINKLESLFDIMLSIHMVYDSDVMGEWYSCVFRLDTRVFILYSYVFCEYSTCIPRMHRMSVFIWKMMYLYGICTVFVCILYVFAGLQCPECDGNPAQLICLCKGFKHVGICSHVLAVNHTIKAHNVE